MLVRLLAMQVCDVIDCTCSGGTRVGEARSVGLIVPFAVCKSPHREAPPIKFA